MAAGENILQKIAARTRERVAAEKRAVSLDEMARRARSKAARELAASKTGEFEFSFESALKARGMSFICEVKRASPMPLISPCFARILSSTSTWSTRRRKSELPQCCSFARF